MNASTCVDVNECLVNNGGCSQICANNDGSFACGCESGLVLANDSRTCLDRDECAESASVCLASQICVNTYKHYYCIDSNIVGPRSGAELRDGSPRKAAASDDQNDPASGVHDTSVFGNARSGYTPATVGLAAAMAAVGAGVLLVVVVLTFRFYRKNQKTSEQPTSHDRSSRIFGSISSRGFGSVNSKFSQPGDELVATESGRASKA